MNKLKTKISSSVNKVRKAIIKKLIKPADEYIYTGFSEGEPVKIYYQESSGKYLIGHRSNNWYYFEMTLTGISSVASRYLPWGKTVEKCTWNPITKEMDPHTYGSEPVEVDFNTWISGISKDIYKQYVDRLMEMTPEDLLKFQEIHKRIREREELVNNMEDI